MRCNWFIAFPSMHDDNLFLGERLYITRTIRPFELLSEVPVQTEIF